MKRKDSNLNTVDKVTMVIEHLSRTRDGCGVNETSRILDLDPSGVYRIMSALQKSEWVRQDSANKKYLPGVKLLEIGVSMLSNLDLRTAGEQYLTELQQVTGESCFLNLHVGSNRIVIDQRLSHHELLYHVPIGRRAPLWLGASSKVIMAYLPPEEIDAIFSKLTTQKEMIDLNKLRQELDEIRDRGFAISKGELAQGIRGIAAPVFCNGHQVLGSLSTAGPASRVSAAIARKHTPIVKNLARKISLQLGDHL